VIDTWHLIIHLILFLTVLITVYFCLHIIPILFQFIVSFICSHIICTCTSLFILTHSLGVLTSWICISRSVTIYYWSNIWRGSQVFRGALSSLCSILVFSLYFIHVVLCDSQYIGLIAYYNLLLICYHMWLVICYIAVLSCHHSDYIACSGYFRLSMYTWGILLAYIRRRLSSRFRFHIFWKAERDRVFLASEPGPI